MFYFITPRKADSVRLGRFLAQTAILRSLLLILIDDVLRSDEGASAAAAAEGPAGRLVGHVERLLASAGGSGPRPPSARSRHAARHDGAPGA